MLDRNKMLDLICVRDWNGGEAGCTETKWSHGKPDHAVERSALHGHALKN